VHQVWVFTFLTMTCQLSRKSYDEESSGYEYIKHRTSDKVFDWNSLIKGSSIMVLSRWLWLAGFVTKFESLSSLLVDWDSK